MRLLATTGPDAGTQGAFYVVACILFAVAVIVAWLTPALNRAVAFGFAGLAVVAFVWAWVQLAAS